MSKRIRDLDPYSESAPLKTGHYLIVGDTDTEVTRRSSIRDVINSYNVSVVEEQDELPDDITVIDPDTGEEVDVPNPLKNIVTKVESVDTDGDGTDDLQLNVDVTPITSENLDKLVKPGGGLEIIEVCQDSSGTTLPCTVTVDGVERPNPEVTLKSKQLSFAVSSESKNIIIYCNGATGSQYSSTGNYSVNSQGEVSTKFVNLWNAYRYIREKIASKDTNVTIRVETDLDEGQLGPHDDDAANIRGQGAYMSNALLSVTIIGWDSANNNHSLLNGELRKLTVKRVSKEPYPQAMFWFNSQNENIWGIHFALDCEDHSGLHSIFRSSGTEGNTLRFYSCKCSFRGSTFLMFDPTRGGNIEFQNFSDSVDYVDTATPAKGFYMPSFEFYSSPKSDGTASYTDIFFGGEAASAIRIVEYAGTSFLSNGSRWQNRFHFSGPQDYSLGQLGFLESSSLFAMNTNFSADSNGGFINYSNNYIFSAFGFNTFSFAGTIWPNGDNIPFGFVADTSKTDLTLFSPTKTEGVDYAYEYTIGGSLLQANNETARVHKAEDGTETTLSNYWPNHTFPPL